MASMLPPKGAKGNEGDEDEDDQNDDDGQPIDDDDDDDGDDPEDDDSDDGDDDDGEGDDDDNPQAPQAAPVADEAVVSVEVDGQATEFTVAQLKAMAAQGPELSRKSQEAELVGQRAATVLRGSLQLVTEDLEAYNGVDWVLEGQRMDPGEFQWHRENYTRLQGRYQRLVGAAEQFGKEANERQTAQLQEQAVAAVRALQDPTSGIKGFGPEMYKEIVQFAVAAGLPEDDVSQIVNPNVLKIINDARLYRAAQKATGEKVQMAPKKVRRSGGSESIPTKTEKVQKNLERKVKSGQASDSDAMALLMGRWGVKGK
ncbi:hypothetical protein [Novosphingobium panipatense]